MLEKYPNLYIYWPTPSKIHDPADLLCYPVSDRIKYFQMDYGDDRFREYRRLYYQQEKMIAHYGEFWDWDLLVTNRTPLVPLYRQLVNHHSSTKQYWSRKILILEDFPQMNFKSAASVANDKSQDSQTILGYYCADKTCISAYWEKELIIASARKYFAGSVIRHLINTVLESTPTIVEKTELKSPEFRKARNEPFTIGFAGRLILGHQFNKIFDLMAKNWVYRHTWPVQCVITTQSQGAARVDVPNWIELIKADRDLFWKTMRERVHVGVFFSPEEDYSMSLIEPMILGVPYAVYRATWSIASLGPDYPFFFSSQLEAYQIVKDFYDNYDGMYFRYAEWSKAYFEPLLRQRNSVSIFTGVDDLIAQWKVDLDQYAKTTTVPTSSLLGLLLDEMRGANVPLSFEEALTRADSKGKSRHIADKMEMDQFDLRTSFSTDRNRLRLMLLAHYGATDCGPLPGLMRLPKGV